MSAGTRGSSCVRAREQGFSLIEVLVASLIFLIIALGIIPMFTMSAASNLQGQDSTKVANLARSHFDELLQLQFTDPLLTVTSGTTLVRNEYYDPATDSWIVNPGTPPAGTLYVRITTIKQFDVSDLTTPIDATAAASDPTKVQIKQITVEVDNLRAGGPLGGGKHLVIQGYKSA